MNNFSAAKFIRESVNNLPNGAVISFEELYKGAVANGMDPEKKKNLYASCHQEATKGSISRGELPATFCKNSDAPTTKPRFREAQKPISEMVTTTARNTRKRDLITNESIYAYLENQLGPDSIAPKTHNVRRFLLLGDQNGEYIINKFMVSEKREPTHWCKITTGPSVFVGLWSE